jgi:hypothetical protein
MNGDDEDVLRALRRVNHLVPGVALALLDRTLTLRRQHEFADILIAMGNALHEHATVVRAPAEQGDETSASGIEAP